ncbi:MAG TPA: glycosyl transferase family 2, partial [Desulfobulbaceae bacterium]|nr:glycosyl transferase family 2 [Desulfobulbaceae bacterium]
PETILLDPATEVGRDTIINGSVQVTGNSTIGRNTLLETAVVMQKCTLGARAMIGAHSVLHNCTVEAEEHIPPLTYKVG